MNRRPALARRARGAFLLSLTLMLLALGARPTRAHDLWLLAGRYHLGPYEATRAFINSGDRFPESLTLVGEHRISSLAVIADGYRATMNEFRVDRKSLSFDVTVQDPGGYVLAVGTKPRRVRLLARDFQDYLDENGLDHVLKLREELGESESPALERYSKWAKAFIEVGEYEPGASGETWAEPVGQALEIVPTSNPNGLRPSDSLEVRVLFLEEPLAGALVSGGRAGGPAGEVSAVTDAAGRASLRLVEPGRWYLRVVHMSRVEDDPGVQWESYWASVTFEIEEVP